MTAPGGWRVRTVLVLASLAGATAARAETCEGVYGGIVDARLYARMTCDTLDRQRIETAHSPVVVDIVLRDSAANPAVTAALTRSLDTVRAMIPRAVHTYDAFGEMPPRTQVVVGWKPGPIQSAFALHVAGVTPADRCESNHVTGAWNNVSCALGPHCVAEIALSTSGGGVDDATLQDVVAHEMFHCLQEFNFGEHFLSYERSRWWAEGTAEYFATLVVPAGLRQDFAALFDAQSPQHDIFNIGQPATVGYPLAGLFSYIDGPRGRGSEWLYKRIRALRYGSSDQDQARQLAHDSDFVDQFHRFARSYIGGEVATRIEGLPVFPIHAPLEAPVSAGREGGSFVYLDGAFAFAAAGDAGESPPRAPLHIFAGQIELGARTHWRVTKPESAGRTSVRVDGVDWMELRASDALAFDTCDNGVTLQAVTTHVDPDRPFRPSLTAKRNAADTSQTPCRPPDRCLVGHWRMTDESRNDVYEFLRAKLPRAELQPLGGPIEVDFGAGGFMSFTYNGFGAKGKLGAASTPVSTAVRLNGQAFGRWGVERPGLMASRLSLDTTRLVVQVRGMPATTAPLPSPFASAFVRYTCSGDHATFVADAPGAPTTPQAYHRVGPARSAR